MIYDAIIVGLGPAGITAAINLARASKKVLAIGKDLGILSEDDIIYNFYGQEKPISGPKLIKQGIAQASNLGVDILYDSVLDVEVLENGFIVKTAALTYETRTVLLATGSKRKTLDIKNFNRYVGKGISLCEVCDGFLYKNKKIAIIGKNPYLQKAYDYLLNITDEIIVFSEDEGLDYSHLIGEKIMSFEGDKRLTKIITDKSEYEVNGAFIAVSAPNSIELANRIGCVLDDKSRVVVSNNMQTNVDGIFAAGDILEGEKQIVKSSYEGYKAALSMIKYLRK